MNWVIANGTWLRFNCEFFELSVFSRVVRCVVVMENNKLHIHVLNWTLAKKKTFSEGVDYVDKPFKTGLY